MAPSSVTLDAAGARGEDDAADVTLISSDAVFRDIMAGDQNPVMAYMSGKLKVSGVLSGRATLRSVARTGPGMAVRGG